jgi:tRNA-(ms[2]io[6]A)-hydroxylase
MFQLKADTPPQWVEVVLRDLNRFLMDHAACERKANATALSLITKYPHKSELVKQMMSLAQDELSHFVQVVDILYQRGGMLGADVKDPYINALLKLCRHSEEGHLLDRLLLFGIIEARGCERFLQLSEALKEIDPILSTFYFDLVKAEARHHATFLHIVKAEYEEQEWKIRLDELLTQEAVIMLSLPLSGHLH